MVAHVVALMLSLAHPLHTTLTEVSESRGVVRATIRVFADDYAKARVAASFAFVDGSGKALPMTSCGVRHAGDVYFVCVEAVHSLDGLRLRAAMLHDLYEDQVNVVQATVRGSRRSLLFVRGDGAKAL